LTEDGVIAAALELCAARPLAEVEVPPADAGPWDDRLRALMGSVRRQVGRFTISGFGSGFGESTQATKLGDAVQAILVEGGFGTGDLALASSALFTFMLGQIELDALRPAAVGTEVVDT
jgi:TetR/AcrR family tetracycline transcriptional repressor